MPVFADNCGVQSVSNDFNGGTDASGIYNYGTTTVVYTVTDINSNAATFNQQVVVELENEPEHGLIIPEAFSPNEDGFNDRFEILGLEQYSENELKVYNVHGIEVFTMSNYDNSWDGMAKAGFGDNSKLPTGTYYYVLILNLNSEESFVKGFIYLKQE
jgi:gliding motility-associated-like protein